MEFPVYVAVSSVGLTWGCWLGQAVCTRCSKPRRIKDAIHHPSYPAQSTGESICSRAQYQQPAIASAQLNTPPSLHSLLYEVSLLVAGVMQVHQLFKEQGCKLVDGYAPFCKHVFVPNFVGVL